VLLARGILFRNISFKSADKRKVRSDLKEVNAFESELFKHVQHNKM